jgi:SAM-dependent methyltransferase
VEFDGDEYQARFDELVEQGFDVHGEADFVASCEPAAVLDAGCGTGRVAIELARRGIEVVGVDISSSMIQTAQVLGPELDFRIADLAELDLGRTFDAVVLAGNVPLFAEPGTQPRLIAGCARHVAPGGVLIAGFQLDRGYTLAEYDDSCRAEGLTLLDRFATWERGPFSAAGDYAVSVHQRRAR